jgi:acetolactate synthase small subunit
MVLERRSYSLNALTFYRERNEMKLSVSGSEKNYDQIVKQLAKLVDVIEVTEKERVKMYSLTGAPAAMA